MRLSHWDVALEDAVGDAGTVMICVVCFPILLVFKMRGPLKVTTPPQRIRNASPGRSVYR